MHTAGLVWFLEVPEDLTLRLGTCAKRAACSDTGVRTSGGKDLPGVEEKQFLKCRG